MCQELLGTMPNIGHIIVLRDYNGNRFFLKINTLAVKRTTISPV